MIIYIDSSLDTYRPTPSAINKMNFITTIILKLTYDLVIFLHSMISKV